MYGTAADRAQAGARSVDGGGLVVGLVVSGAMRVTQDRRSILVPAGRVVFYDGVTCCGLRAEEPHRYLVVYVRGQLLRIRPEDREALIARDLSRLAAGKTLAALLGSIAQGRTEPSFDAGLHLGDAIVSCVRAVVAEVRGSSVGGRSEALFSELAEWLDEHLADEDLSAKSLAAHHYLSPRYVRKLFAERATTVTAYIRQRRLERIRDDLMQPWCANLPVSVIAARWGIKDPSVFSRAFTRQFGQGPQRFRKEVAAGAKP
jgi:AraC-like DNA-binding protein